MRLIGASVGNRKVVVHAARARFRLVHDDGADRGGRADHDGRERQVHDRDPEASGDPHTSQAAHDRVQQKRDQGCDQEEEDDALGRTGHNPEEEEHQGKADELNPARDLDSRGPGRRPGHTPDGTAPVVPLRAASRPPAWDWDFELDGALALAREPSVAQSLQPDPTCVTVPRMSPPPGHAPAVRRRRAEAAAARRTRRVVGLLLLAAVALITLLLTAFGSGRSHARVTTGTPAPATRLLPSGPPQPQVVAMISGLRLELPIAQGRVTAIGYHASGDGALALDPVGHQANQGLLSRLGHRLFGGGSNGLRYYVIDGGTGPSTSALDVGAAPDTDVYSPVDGTIVAITPCVLDGKAYG